MPFVQLPLFYRSLDVRHHAVSVSSRSFPSEQHCSDYIYKLKWPDGFRCPRCGHHQAYSIDTRQQPFALSSGSNEATMLFP
ncbi:transposase [Paenibacillus thailandensis]|uniref:Transposase n=1 Tax=Paenibacillus thailandensis TaxID=393250 RepID=A0ABW5QWQ7_9BACL